VLRGDLDAAGLPLLRHIVDPLLVAGVDVQIDLGGIEFVSLAAAAYLTGDELQIVAVVSPSRAVERAVEIVHVMGRLEPEDPTTDRPTGAPAREVARAQAGDASH
jgi:hypothetical protein